MIKQQVFFYKFFLLQISSGSLSADKTHSSETCAPGFETLGDFSKKKKEKLALWQTRHINTGSLGLVRGPLKMQNGGLGGFNQIVENKRFLIN